jgi:hypothetical protein
MDSQLIAVISGVVHQAYPEPWETAWLSLPLSPRSPYTFCVMCADLPGIKDQRSVWPPAASNPKTWIHWEQPDREGFWIRPRKDNPILRDRLILVRARELLGARRRSTIDQDDVMDACSFAAQSLRFVWHNPAKGGASQPHSAHFQSAPLYWHNTVNTASRQYTVPCCLYQNDQIVWHETKTIAIAVERVDLLITRVDETLPELKAAVEEVGQRSDRTVRGALMWLLVVGLVLIAAASAAALVVKRIGARWAVRTWPTLARPPEGPESLTPEREASSLPPARGAA